MQCTLKISEWKYNTNSPIVFMVDDIANVYINNSDSSNLQVGEDWGHFGISENSMWDFLNKNLYSIFPDIRTTFFLVTDKRSVQIIDTKYSYSEAMDKDESFMSFLKMLNKDDKIELAYHGTTHGYPNNTGFQQEWNTYKSLDHAIETIEYGKELYKKVLGTYPKGGKYCGYEKGNYGDESINKTGFLWWCRDWDGEREKNPYRKDLSDNFEYFANTIDIPSNIDGSFRSIYRPQLSIKYLSTLMKYLQGRSIEKNILSLYDKKQIISIQEHTSPYRTDGKIQYPNIILDIANLQYIFKFLNKLDVWYATAAETAEYFQIFKNVKIKENLEGFVFLVDGDIKIKEGTVITVIIESKKNDAQVTVQIKDEVYLSYEKNGVILIDIPIYKNLSYKILDNKCKVKQKKKLLIVNRARFGHHIDSYKYCQYLKDEFEVTYICLDTDMPKVKEDGVNIVYVPRSKSLIKRGFDFIMACRRQIKSDNIDLVFIVHFFMASLIKIGFYKEKFVLDIRTGAVDQNPINRAIYNIFLKIETICFKNITIISECLRKKLKLNNKKCHLLPLGSDPFTYALKSFKNINLLYVGTLNGRDIDKTVLGLSKFLKKNPIDKLGCSVTYDIVGFGTEENIKLLKDVIEKEKLYEIVKFHGRKEYNELKPYFEKANIGVSYIPIMEHYQCQPPTKTFEYINSGLFCIGTSTKEHENLISNANGILCQDNAESFANALENLNNKKDTIDSSIVSDTLKNYSWKQIIKENLLVYMEKVIA